jgi:hypothetical protein
MSEKVFKGILRGNGGTADCLVTSRGHGHEYVHDVTPPLPDGDYDLSVNGIDLKARCTNGVWKLIDA